MKRLPFTEANYRAVIEGRKTVTRRVRMGENPPYSPGETVALTLPHWRWVDDNGQIRILDEVTHRERWQVYAIPHVSPHLITLFNKEVWRLRPAMFMPVWACLHFAEIVSWQLQVLGDVNDAEAIMEGCYTDGHYWYAPDVPRLHCSTALAAYDAEWGVLNAKRGYPWRDDLPVWRIEFRLKERSKPCPTSRKSWSNG
jgi:hypothetical protein